MMANRRHHLVLTKDLWYLNLLVVSCSVHQLIFSLAEVSVKTSLVVGGNAYNECQRKHVLEISEARTLNSHEWNMSTNIIIIAFQQNLRIWYITDTTFSLFR